MSSGSSGASPSVSAASISERARSAEVMRHQLRRGRAGGEIVEQRLGDATVQNLTPAPEQILISRVLNQRVLETIIGFGRQALNQQDVGFREPLQRHLQWPVLRAGHRAQQGIGETASNYRSDLRHL